ncbi:MAG: hypothetical protein JWL91_431 [Sphingomonas bacterium]|jgi:glycerol uptake facilitator-like aquaporin|nr:hypothetical protein [Sphingomonas bacterium]MDB5688555.1 hypothetical protein [Sphingomonas bacterium]
MAHEHLLGDIVDTAKALASALAPAALGSAVAQIHEKGMGWRDRVLAYVAGICTSYYVTLGLSAWFHLDPFVTQAIAFVLGMIAVKSTPRFIAAASDLIASLPGLIRDRIANRKDQA